MIKTTQNFTTTIKKTVPTKVVNGRLRNLALISVDPKPLDNKVIDLVIGADYDQRSACSFGKTGLTELIGVLTEIRDAMGNPNDTGEHDL